MFLDGLKIILFCSLWLSLAFAFLFTWYELFRAAVAMLFITFLLAVAGLFVFNSPQPGKVYYAYTLGYGPSLVYIPQYKKI